MNLRKERIEAIVTPPDQGPFLMTPCTIEMNENKEEAVTNLLCSRYSTSSTRQRNMAVIQPNPTN
ncbi:hypothetical protein PtA15_12A200 [Puccinia triticina]|uniref:Uncharacterized protein n=1 Tax=Puccinia triticina TaxID=208348 RepID=A0ABY7CY33_9BASI|nr:uncharacterized protein PtA15_12A200 [Puccinia triticina]WAQ90214.1 hypothetical protein PtA15_12A200 [Puccinia triticina]